MDVVECVGNGLVDCRPVQSGSGWSFRVSATLYLRPKHTKGRDFSTTCR